MANANLQRTENQLKLFRLTPPKPLPETFIKRFPELRSWQAENLEIFKKDVDDLGRHLGLLLAGLQATSSTPVATIPTGLGSAAYLDASAFDPAGAAATVQIASQPRGADLTALEGLTGTNVIYYRSGEGAWSAVTIGSNMTFISGTLNSVASGGGFSYFPSGW